MGWDAIGAIAETLGALAVIATLVYLAIQVRHARAEARRAISQGRGEALRSVLARQFDDRVNRLSLSAEAALGGSQHAFVTALREQTGLSEPDAMLLLWDQITWWNYYLQIIPKVDELPPMERVQFEVPIARYGRPGVARLFYETYIRQFGHPDAIRYIEGVLAARDARASADKPLRTPG
jgi:hypothetical protein